jgi:hypothetical protein
MIIIEADRVDALVFTLPIHVDLFADDQNPSAEAKLVAWLFDSYLAEVRGDLASLDRVGLPWELRDPAQVAEVGLDPDPYWRIWQCRAASLTIAGSGG